LSRQLGECDRTLWRLRVLGDKVDLSPFLIVNFPSSRPSLRSFTLPVPDISSNSHDPFQLNERLAALTFQVA
jgi:hypothetical protein